MDDIGMRTIENLDNRLRGPMKLRFILQPATAIVFAILAGIKDAKAGRKPYFLSLLFYLDSRAEMLKDGWESIGKVFIIALILDVLYKVFVLHFVYPGAAIIVAFILATTLPYPILRGLLTRLTRIK